MSQVDNDPIRLYLTLLKKTLSYSLWEEPGVPLEMLDYRLPVLGSAARVLTRALRAVNFRLVLRRDIDARQATEGEGWSSQSHTMIGMKRLDNLQVCVETVLRDNVPGDLIETGVWRGGAVVLMRGVLAAHGVDDRRVFVADSFEGLPRPDAEQYPMDKGDRHHKIGFLVASEEEVRSTFRKYGLLDDNVVFLKGWFKDTLPTAPIERLAVMRLDGDMYESTVDALDSLYPKLSVGGYCIIDDYVLEPCRRAVDEYRSRNGVRGELTKIDWTGVFWRKERE